MGQILAGAFHVAGSSKAALWDFILLPCAKLPVVCGVLTKKEQFGLRD